MIFFTSDQHFGHKNIIEYCKRPWTSVEEMNEGLIERFNKKVGPEDTTYHLGDFSLQEKNVKKHLFRLNGKHVLVPGNHDACHPKNKHAPEARNRYFDAGFLWVWTKDILTPAYCHGFIANHLPYEGDNAPQDRYTAWRPQDQGHTLLHGHVHNAWKVRLSSKGTKMINVGVDVWNWEPVALEELETL